ncbi:MAG: hypothetical protein IT450_11425 [Phycisphaerales bacterium]|nr:hypothetical protein [Phycisphaerales bacterium]
MARTLTFRNETLGDGGVMILPGTAPATPPAVLSALFSENARISSESRNLVHALTFAVHMTKADEIAFARRAMQIQMLAGLAGQLLYRDGATTKVRWNDCILAEAPQVDVPEGFGGRFTPGWRLTFWGSLPPEFP